MWAVRGSALGHIGDSSAVEQCPLIDALPSERSGLSPSIDLFPTHSTRSPQRISQLEARETAHETAASPNSIPRIRRGRRMWKGLPETVGQTRDGGDRHSETATNEIVVAVGADRRRGTTRRSIADTILSLMSGLYRPRRGLVWRSR